MSNENSNMDFSSVWKYVPADPNPGGDVGLATREPPSGQLEVARPEQQENRLQQQQVESADPPLAADDEDNLVVSEYEEGTRSDEPQQAQAQGRQLSQQMGGCAVGPKKLYDENGALYWVGPDGPESDALPGGGTQKMLTSVASGAGTVAAEAGTAAVSAVGSMAVEGLKPVAAGLKDAVGNPLADVAEGVSSSMAAVSEGVVKQMNTMLIILGLAYVAGAAVRGGG